MNKNALLALLIVSLSSCFLTSPKWVFFEDKRQPQIDEYKMSKQNFTFKNSIDTNAIYVSENQWVSSNRKGELVREERTLYNYMIFSNRGVMFMMGMDENNPIDYSHTELIEKGQYCFYQVEGKQLKVEFYNYDKKFFEYWYGNIINDGDIFFYKFKGRPWSTGKGILNYFYEKKERIKPIEALSFPR